MKETDWELVFLNSKVNDCDYRESEWNQKWEWPEGTWFQNRRAELQWSEYLLREKEKDNV